MKKKKYYNGHNQRKKNKNIVFVYPTSLLVHHRLSSMITKSMIYFYFSRGTIIFYFSYLHFSVSNVSYFSFCFELFVIFERVSRRLYRLETAVRKKIYPLVLQPQHPPRKSIANLVVLRYGHVAYYTRAKRSSNANI